MLIRTLLFILSISTLSYAYASVIVSEPVPWANCKCISADNCTNIQTRKYNCNTTTAVKTTDLFSNSNNLNSIKWNNIQTIFDRWVISNPNRELTNFLNLIIYGLIILYFLPIFIVLFSKNRAHKLATILINIFLGWSVIGWFLALFLSLQSNLIKVEIIEKINGNKDTII